MGVRKNDGTNGETTMSRLTANDLNERLAAGGIVQVATMTKAWLYKKSHAGCFSEKDGSLYRQHGKSVERLSHGEQLLVGVRIGWMQK
jgi:hypothetical protein